MPEANPRSTSASDSTPDSSTTSDLEVVFAKVPNVTPDFDNLDLSDGEITVYHAIDGMMNVRELTGRLVGVVVSDSFGRPFRMGTTDVAIGAAGIRVLEDLRGTRDRIGYELKERDIVLIHTGAGAYNEDDNNR